MSYPGDPAGGQQPSQYPYSGGQGYPPPQQPGPAPVSGYPGDPGPAYGASYGGGYDPNTPPVSAPPTSGHPYPTQMSGPPMSSPPMSGPPIMGPQPYSGAPVLGPSMPGDGMPPMSAPPLGTPAAPRRSPLAGIFGSLMVLFLLAAAVLTVLYVTKNGDYNDAKKTVAARDQTIKTQNDDKAKLQADLKKAEDDLASTKRDLGGAQGQADELKRQKQVISKCISLLGEAGQARAKGDTATADAKEKEANPVCDEAGRYLD